MLWRCDLKLTIGPGDGPVVSLDGEEGRRTCENILQLMKGTLTFEEVGEAYYANPDGTIGILG